MRKRGLAVFLALLLALAAGSSVVQARVEPGTDGPTASAAATAEYAYIQLSGAPVALYDGSTPGLAATRPGQGQRLDLDSPAARAYGQHLARQRAAYRAWLANHAPGVEVVAEYSLVYNGLAVRLNGFPVSRLRRGPGAVAAGLSASYTPAMNASTGLTGAPAMWAALGGVEHAGAGVKVGIIDTGIDAAHPFLAPAGLTAPAGYPKGWSAFTSDKVIVARVFHQSPWATPEDLHGHGTHVSGTVAGVAGTAAPMASGLSGMAPRAWLGNYNVFPGGGSAFSVFIAAAVESAVADGMDVLNLSLGGSAHRGKDLLDEAVGAASAAGVVVVIAAGNSGPGRGTVGSPGTADAAITVAASTNAHMFAGTVQVGPDSWPATGGDNGAELAADLTAAYADWDVLDGAGDGQACTPLSDADAAPLIGKIAVIYRGTCFFSDKVHNAAAAGAVGVVVTTYPGLEPSGMSMADPVTIPAVMVSYDAGETMRAVYGADLTAAVATLSPPHEIAATADMLAEFSSRGPTPHLTLKPDLSAPGVNIYSSLPGGAYGSWQGTSMATPHVAGAAALLCQLHPDWTPQQIKAALMGTATEITVREPDGSGGLVDRLGRPLEIGAGRIDLAAALSPAALASPASVSFGRVSPHGNRTYEVTVWLENVTGAEQTYTLTGTADAAVAPGSLTLAAGEQGSFTVTATDRSTPGDHQGYIMAASAAGSIRIPYYYSVQANK